MSRRMNLAAGAAALALLLTLPFPLAAQPPDQRRPNDSPAPQRNPDIAQVKSTAAEDLKDLMVTVYNNNYGLIREVRAIELPTGLVELEYADVAELIDPTSVAFRSLTDPDAVAILEQNYRYDLLNPQSLLEKFVGRPVAYTIRRMEDNTEVIETREGILLSNNNGQIVRFGDEIVINPPGHVTLPELPEDLLAQPTLIWLVRNQAPQLQDVEAAYLTDGMNWKADYVVVLQPNATDMDLTGWVTINNNSGNVYRDAKLKLVAGDVQRVQPERKEMMMMARDAAMAGVAEEAFAEKAFFEYHLYTLGRPTTLYNNETKQISLLEATGIPYDKLYIMESGPWVVQSSMHGEERRNLSVMVEFENDEESQLGIALPGGRVRFYQADDDESLQLVGEDMIEHTPRDETVRLQLGEAFDVVGTRTQTSFRKLADRVSEMSYRVEIRNHKDEDITATVLEHVYGDWEIISQSHEFEKKDSTTIAFELPVPARGETVLTYTVRVRW